MGCFSSKEEADTIAQAPTESRARLSFREFTERLLKKKPNTPNPYPYAQTIVQLPNPPRPQSRPAVTSNTAPNATDTTSVEAHYQNKIATRTEDSHSHVSSFSNCATLSTNDTGDNCDERPKGGGTSKCCGGLGQEGGAMIKKETAVRNRQTSN